jgi:hypothetical protein
MRGAGTGDLPRQSHPPSQPRAKGDVSLKLAVRLVLLLAAGAAFAVILGVAAATPAAAEREWSDFRSCVASIPHPARPATLLTREPAAERRALALLGAQDACAHSSGVDGSARERPLEWLRALRPGASDGNGALSFFERCSAERRSARYVTEQIAAGIDCYRSSGGLSHMQFELATGFDPQIDHAPIQSKRRFPRTLSHVRDGTWWSHSCS